MSGMKTTSQAVCIEDLIVGQSIKELYSGPLTEQWSANGMTWTRTSRELAKPVPMIGFGRNQRFTHELTTTRIA